jgi:AraC-like DNA-binding protein
MNTRAEEFLVPCSYTRIVARELGMQERDLPQLLIGTGLSASSLLTAENTYITSKQQMRVLNNAQHILGLPEFGLRLGRQLQPSSHGPMGYLVLSSPDVITALDSFAEFLPVRLPFSSVRITLDDRWLSCCLTLKINAKPVVRRVLQECFALMIQSVVESVLGRELRDARIDLAHEKPEHHVLYGEYLHSPVYFSRKSSAFLIPAEVARFPNASGNSDAYALAQNVCRGILDQMPASNLSTADRVRRLLLSAPIGSLTASDVACTLFVTKRTLQRRLERESTSYREITEKLHSELAVRHLREPGQTVESIALLMGYFDTAAFRKAFHRWHGQSPAQYRHNL